MEPKFQTSFIPKKPISAPSVNVLRSAGPHKGTSVFMTLAVVLFIVSLAGVGGAYAWKQYLTSAQATYKSDLAAREKQFNIDTIEQLKQVNVQIDTAKSVLANHIALSQIFSIISQMTIESVRFLGLDVTVPDNLSDGVKISMTGYGTSLAAVAFQSDVLSRLDQYGLRKIIKNPILSNPSLDSSSGDVSFGLTAVVDPSSLLYEKSVGGTAVGTSTVN
jgi:hypothetical protein